jgi:hypothetical protein
MLAVEKIDVILLEAEFAELYAEQPLFCDILLFLKGFGYALYSIPRQVHDDIGQLVWADVIFCNRNTLKLLRTKSNI